MAIMAPYMDVATQRDPDLLRDELVRRARRIEVKSRRLASLMTPGEYRSVFRGEGIEFDSVREYVYGDDVRSIDWNVTARTGRPFVKRYVEARERSVLLAVDRSASMDFGSGARTKADVAAELCAVLAVAASSSRDRVGVLRFTDRVCGYLPPARGVEWPKRVVHELLYGDVQGRRTDHDALLDDLERRLSRRQIVFLVSDFADPLPVDKLARLRGRHDVVAVRVEDPREVSLEGAGLVGCVDPETGSRFTVDAGDRGERAAFERAARSERTARAEELRRAGVDLLTLRTDGDLLPPLLAFFERRQARR